MRCSFILVFWCEFVMMPVLVHVVPNFCDRLPVRLWVGRLSPLPAESLWIVSSKQKWWCLLVCFSPVIGSGWKPVKLHPEGKQLYYLNIARKILASYFGIMITTFAVLYKEQPVTSKSDPDWTFCKYCWIVNFWWSWENGYCVCEAHTQPSA